MQIESLETRRLLSGVLIRHTLWGDANLDASANINDFGMLAANFNTPGAWAMGDFDYSGSVNISDFSLLAANFREGRELGGDSNADGRVDLNDFNHLCETAIDSTLNNLIRNSAGPGDADSNGRIDKFDIRALGARFNSTGRWQDGDFTMGGRVNTQDFALAAANVIARS